jgi:hypothetical protein
MFFTVTRNSGEPSPRVTDSSASTAAGNGFFGGIVRPHKKSLIVSHDDGPPAGPVQLFEFCVQIVRQPVGQCGLFVS